MKGLRKNRNQEIYHLQSEIGSAKIDKSLGFSVLTVKNEKGEYIDGYSRNSKSIREDKNYAEHCIKIHLQEATA